MIWLWLYLAGYVVSVVPIARWFLRVGPVADVREDAFVVAGCALMGLLWATMWPLLIPGWFVYRALVNGLRQEETK